AFRDWLAPGSRQNDLTRLDLERPRQRPNVPKCGHSTVILPVPECLEPDSNHIREFLKRKKILCAPCSYRFPNQFFRHALATHFAIYSSLPTITSLLHAFSILIKRM